MLKPAADEELAGVRCPRHAAGRLLHGEEADGLVDYSSGHFEEEDCAILGGCGPQAAVGGQGQCFDSA